MKKMDYQKNQQIQIEDDNESDKSQHSGTLRYSQASQLSHILAESRKNTILFIKDLQEKTLTPISQSVLQSYNGQIKAFYTEKDIVSMIDKRISKMIRNKKIKKNWNVDDITLLLWFVSKYIQKNESITAQTLTNEDWEGISKLIPGSNPKGCMFKFISLKKIKLSLFSWSKEEQNLLRQLVKKYALNNWKQISENLYQNNPSSKIFRTPKQCRQHWNCYLDPRLKKGPWSQDQDVKLLQNVRQNKGQRKWSLIKHLFQGRTQNALKNRFNLLIQRQKKQTPNRSQSELIKQYFKKKMMSGTTVDDERGLISHSIISSEAQEQIFEEVIQDMSKKGTVLENSDIKNNDLIMKSQKSSFRISQAYQKYIQDNQKNQNRAYPERSELNSYVLMNMGTMTTIYANQQGFYTNILYKPFYSS